MDRLNASTINALPDSVVRGAYVRAETGIGIVHIGPGAFHRAHQAYFTELALAHGGDWGICGVSMNSTGVGDALTPQDCFYTLATLDQEQSFRVVGAIQEILHLPSQRQAVEQRLEDEKVKVVTLTVTEKGYMLNAEGRLDLESKAVQADLQALDQPTTAIGLLAQAMRRRHANGVAPLTVISCDNVSDNGHKLKRALEDFLRASHTDNADSLMAATLFPNTMVDCITPATDDSVKSLVCEALGVEDAWPIQREAFAQWVIERLPNMQLPAWEAVGVTFTNNIDAYENAKLRILNLSHSALAYIGPLYQCETVYEAISHPKLEGFVNNLLDQEIIPALDAPEELDLNDYKAQTLRRFQNPNIRHLLAQIAHDGTQKLQIRLVPALAANRQAGRSVSHLSQMLIAWSLFVVNAAKTQSKLVDPLADSLLAMVHLDQLRDDSSASFDQCLALLRGADLISEEQLVDAEIISALESAYDSISRLQV